MSKQLKNIYCIAKDTVLKFNSDRCFNRAAGLAYTTLLSLVPLLTVIFSVLRAFPVFKGIQKQLQNFIFNNFVADSAHTVQHHLQAFIAQTAKLPAWGLASLMASAVLLVFSMELAFNSIWKVKHRRHGFTAFILYWGVLTLIPILLGVGFALSSYVLSFPQIVASLNSLHINTILIFIAPYIVTLIAFTILYITMPNCKVPAKYAFYAAIPATLLFEIVKDGLTIYITHFPTYKLIYGALAAIPIFLVWLYLMWTVILFGAVLSQVLSNNTTAKNDGFFPKLFKNQ